MADCTIASSCQTGFEASEGYYALVLARPKNNQVDSTIARLRVEEVNEGVVFGSHALMLP